MMTASLKIGLLRPDPALLPAWSGHASQTRGATNLAGDSGDVSVHHDKKGRRVSGLHHARSLTSPAGRCQPLSKPAFIAPNLAP